MCPPQASLFGLLPQAKRLDPTQRTLFVGNLPYDVTEDDVREALEALGCAATSGVRLPLDKETNPPRGFAFVEFVSKQEATKALNALQSTHLYGRHIVVSYAEQERSVEEMRKKMRKELSDATTSGGATSLGERSLGAGGGGAQEGEEADLGFEI